MNQTVKQSIKSIKIIYTGLILGLVFFLATSIFMISLNGPLLEGQGDELFYPFVIISNFIAVFSIAAGIVVFKRKMRGVEELELLEKLFKYREGVIIRAAMMEGAAFFFIVGYFIFGTPVLIIESFAFTLILAFFFPTNTRISKEIQHDPRELTV